MHKTCVDMLHIYLCENPPPKIETALDIVDSVLASAQCALCTCIHRTLGISPGSLVFHRDMLLPIPVLADYNLIRECRQTVIDDNACRLNLHHQF